MEQPTKSDIELLQKRSIQLEGLREWRKRILTEVTLPSGLTVTLKKVNLLDLAAHGSIPAPLLGEADALTAKGGKEFTLAEFPKFAELSEVVVRACVVYPPLADHGDEEHLGLDEMSMEDQMFIFNWSQTEAKAMAPFLEKPRPRQEPVPGSEELQPATEPDNGHLE